MSLAVSVRVRSPQPKIQSEALVTPGNLSVPLPNNKTFYATPTPKSWKQEQFLTPIIVISVKATRIGARERESRFLIQRA